MTRKISGCNYSHSDYSPGKTFKTEGCFYDGKTEREKKITFLSRARTFETQFTFFNYLETIVVATVFAIVFSIVEGSPQSEPKECKTRVLSIDVEHGLMGLIGTCFTRAERVHF